MLPEQDALRTANAQLGAEQRAGAGMRRARDAFVAVWSARRARSGAARAIQRTFRGWRLRRLLARTSLDAKARCPPFLLLAAYLWTP